MAVVVLYPGDVLAALPEELVVVQVARVAGDAVVAAHVDGAGHLLAGHEGLVQLLPVARADDPHLGLAVLRVNSGVDLLQRPGEGVQCGRWCLLHEQVPVVAVLEGVHHQVHRVVEGHHEARHAGIRDGYGLPLSHLLHPQGYDTATAGHHVAVARAADGRRRALPELAPLGYRHLLHQGLGDAHRVDGVRRLVGGEHHHVPHPVLYGREEHVLRAQDVRARGLHREELARGHLLEGRGAEHVVHTAHRHVHRRPVADVAYVELHLPRQLRAPRLQAVAHVVLLLLVAREDADLPEAAVEEPPEHGVTETARAACYQQDFLREYTHLLLIFQLLCCK